MYISVCEECFEVTEEISLSCVTTKYTNRILVTQETLLLVGNK